MTDLSAKNSKICSSWMAFLIAMTGLLVYSNTYGVPFYFDDQFVIVQNPTIKHLKHLAWLWEFDPSRFLTHLSFALNYHFFGLDVFPFHLVNILIHALNAYLFFMLLKLVFGTLKWNGSLSDRQRRGVVIFAPFIFLCHPVQTQAVTYIAQRSTLLATFFYLSAIICYILFRLRNRKSCYAYSLLLALTGLFTKPIVITLPLALLLCEFCFFDFSWKKNQKRLAFLIPYFFIAFLVPCLLILWKFKVLDINRLYDVTHETTKLTGAQYFFTQLNVIMTYLRLMILPVSQNLDYDYPISKSLFTFPTWISFVILLSLLIFAIKILRKNKIVGFCMLWIFVTLSLESSFFPISDVINEHRLYLPLIGTAILISYGLGRIIENSRFYTIAMTGCVLILSVWSFQRNQVWTDPFLFNHDIVKKSPKKARAHLNLGIAYFERGKLLKAEEEYKKALSLDPQYALVYNNLSNLYLKQGKIEQAIEHLNQAIIFKPDYATAYYNLANICFLQGKAEMAKSYLDTTIKLDPSLAKAWEARGNIFFLQGNFAAAKNNMARAIGLNPDLASAYYDLGNIFLREDKYMQALDQYSQAIRKNPLMVDAYNNMANIYEFHEFHEQAIALYVRVISINPQYANSYFNLGNSYRKIGRNEEAKRMLAYALKLYQNQGNPEMARLTQNKIKDLEKGLKK